MTDRSQYTRGLLSTMGEGEQRAVTARADTPAKPRRSDASSFDAASYTQAAERKRQQRAAMEAVNAARVTGVTQAVRAAKEAKRQAFLRDHPGAGQAMIWVAPYTTKDGIEVEGHWRKNPNPRRAELRALPDTGDARLNAHIEGVGITGKVAGALGFDESGKRAQTSWGAAVHNSVYGTSLVEQVKAIGGAIVRARQGKPEPGDALILGGTQVAGGALGTAPRGALRAGGGRPPPDKPTRMFAPANDDVRGGIQKIPLSSIFKQKPPAPPHVNVVPLGPDRKIIVLEQGVAYSIVLHPEHQFVIGKLKDGVTRTITTETRAQYQVQRIGEEVHFRGFESDGEPNSHWTIVKAELFSAPQGALQAGAVRPPAKAGWVEHQHGVSHVFKVGKHDVQVNFVKWPDGAGYTAHFDINGSPGKSHLGPKGREATAVWYAVGQSIDAFITDHKPQMLRFGGTLGERKSSVYDYGLQRIMRKHAAVPVAGEQHTIKLGSGGLGPSAIPVSPQVRDAFERIEREEWRKRNPDRI